MKNWILLLCNIALLSSAAATDSLTFLQYSSFDSSVKKTQLEKCLLECYRLDSATSAIILEKFSPLLKNDEHYPVVDSFIQTSEKLNMYSAPFAQLTEETKQLLEQYPPYHSILFENDYVRISWAVTNSGEQEPIQVHPWTSLMVVIQSSHFRSVQSNGNVYEDNWPIGAHLLGPSLDLLSCKNIGPQEYTGLIFEIKTVQSVN